MLKLLLENFPDGVAWNILKFCEHPVARIFKDNIREIHFTKDHTKGVMGYADHDIFAIMINDCPLILLNEITSNMRIIVIDNTISYNGDNIIVFNDVQEYLFYKNYI